MSGEIAMRSEALAKMIDAGCKFRCDPLDRGTFNTFEEPNRAMEPILAVRTQNPFRMVEMTDVARLLEHDATRDICEVDKAPRVILSVSSESTLWQIANEAGSRIEQNGEGYDVRFTTTLVGVQAGRIVRHVQGLLGARNLHGLWLAAWVDATCEESRWRALDMYRYLCGMDPTQTLAVSGLMDWMVREADGAAIQRLFSVECPASSAEAQEAHSQYETEPNSRLTP